MSETIPTGRFTRLRFTPLRDLIRGRVTGRFDWRRVIASAGLPASVGSLIMRIVKRTRLWRGEKADVAGELIAHFTDGLAGGASADDLVRDFGDERAAAKLIRRAKKRNRPLPWHLARYARYVVLAVLLIHGLLVARFLLGRPTVKVDYLARVNEPVLRVPKADRAWPLYRQAILDLGMGQTGRDRTLETPLAQDVSRRLLDARPDDPEWPQLVAWLDAHQSALATLRQATAKPALGFPLGPDGPSYDPEGGMLAEPDYWVNKHPALDHSLVSVVLPHFNVMRPLADLLSADLRVARERGDAARIVANLDAIGDLGRQLRESSSFIVTQRLALGIHLTSMLKNLHETLAIRPDLFSDAELIHLAHRIGILLEGDSASAFINMSAERMFSEDLLQRLYTDDGNGDGRLCLDAIGAMPEIGNLFGNADAAGMRSMLKYAATFYAGSWIGTTATRRDVSDEFRRLYDLIDCDFARPLYSIDPDQSGIEAVQARLTEIRASPIETARYVLVTIFMPSMAAAQQQAERTIASRDGAIVAIALELHRRRHGAYPSALDELTPALLPRVPKDRITGDAVRYRVIDGKPVIYSVGVDRDDDGGRAALNPWRNQPDPMAAVGWDRFPEGKDGVQPIDGDWILFDARRPEGVFP